MITKKYLTSGGVYSAISLSASICSLRLMLWKEKRKQNKSQNIWKAIEIRYHAQKISPLHTHTFSVSSKYCFLHEKKRKKKNSNIKNKSIMNNISISKYSAEFKKEISRSNEITFPLQITCDRLYRFTCYQQYGAISAWNSELYTNRYFFGQLWILD